MAFLREHMLIVILALGVALAAGGGARLGVSDFDATVRSGQSEVVPSGSAQTPQPAEAGRRLREWAHQGLPMFSCGIVMILFAAVMTRRRQTKARLVLDENGTRLDFGREIGLVIEEVARLRQLLEADAPDTAAIRDQLAQLQLTRMEQLFANRSQLEHQFGVAGFAAVIGPLAGAERLLNRTWTTLVDHHLPETRASIALAEVELQVVQRELNNLKDA